jgi:DNA-binding GntR family transcriptional regulator
MDTVVASNALALPDVVIDADHQDVGLPQYYARRQTGESRSRRDELIERVIQAIEAGRPAVGGRSSEAELAADLGLSRTPLREALAILTRDGIVQQVPQVGFFVVRVSSPTVQEITALRGAIEPIAAWRCVGRGGLEALEPLLGAMAAADSAGAFGAADTAFHVRLLELAGFGPAVPALTSWRNQLRIFRAEHAFLPGQREDVIREHADILHAIRTLGPRAAYSAAEAHLGATQGRLIGASWLPNNYRGSVVNVSDPAQEMALAAPPR